MTAVLITPSALWRLRLTVTALGSACTGIIAGREAGKEEEGREAREVLSEKSAVARKERKARGVPGTCWRMYVNDCPAVTVLLWCFSHPYRELTRELSGTLPSYSCSHCESLAVFRNKTYEKGREWETTGLPKGGAGR